MAQAKEVLASFANKLCYGFSWNAEDSLKDLNCEPEQHWKFVPVSKLQNVYSLFVKTKLDSLSPELLN